MLFIYVGKSDEANSKSVFNEVSTFIVLKSLRYRTNLSLKCFSRESYTLDPILRYECKANKPTGRVYFQDNEWNGIWDILKNSTV